MKAAVFDEYGTADVLDVRDVSEPEHDPDHVRVKVHYAALNPKDYQVREGKMWWLVWGHWPRIPAYDFAGTLLEDADGIEAGTEVFGMIQAHEGGACAEIVSVPPDELSVKPDNVSMREAASLPLASLTALQGLRDELQLQRGQKVLLNGASGGVGTMAVQIAKVMGADVTGVCSGRNVEMVEELGADAVVDYTKTDISDLYGYDAIYDIYGSFPWKKAKHSLKPGGRFCTTIPKLDTVFRGALRRLNMHRAALVVVESRRSDLDIIRDMVEAGDVKPVVDEVYPLDLIREAFEHLETRRTRGKLVIDVAGEASDV
jgi:NADPH:quinone reductase-like Zn-dependent oxidoreductase